MVASQHAFFHIAKYYCPEHCFMYINKLMFLLLDQMLSCKTRGFSFTRALLGISADELHLCGDPASVPLIQEILKVTGDHVEVIGYFCS